MPVRVNRIHSFSDIKTDKDVVDILRRMMSLMDELHECIDSIEASPHQNGKEIAEALKEQCIFYAWPTHVAHSYLEHPENWATSTFYRLGKGIYHKVANKAATRRKLNQEEV